MAADANMVDGNIVERTRNFGIRHGRTLVSDPQKESIPNANAVWWAQYLSAQQVLVPVLRDMLGEVA